MTGRPKGKGNTMLEGQHREARAQIRQYERKEAEKAEQCLCRIPLRTGQFQMGEEACGICRRSISWLDLFGPCRPRVVWLRCLAGAHGHRGAGALGKLAKDLDHAESRVDRRVEGLRKKLALFTEATGEMNDASAAAGDRGHGAAGQRHQVGEQT